MHILGVGHEAEIHAHEYRDIPSDYKKACHPVFSHLECSI